MLIHGQEFDFSLLNANDLDRLEDALDEMTREGEAETARCERENVRLGDRLRAQARVSMRGLDKILGAGASARLGLNENDVSRLYDVLDEITQAAAAEKARYSRPAAVPQNRAQRRAEKRQKDKKHKPPVSYPGQPAAAQMVERVDKTARRYCCEQLKKIGLLSSYDEIGKYMWHGGAHHVGYDVHDVVDALGKPIAPNMVFCVDIGIYAEELGIGFRVEDNCLVTPTCAENLSASVPRTIEDIEAVMAK